MHKLLIVGAYQGGTALLKMLSNMERMKIVAVVDERADAPGLVLARSLGIEVGTDFRPYLSSDIDVILEATGDSAAFEEILRLKQEKTVLIPGTFTAIIMKLISERDELIAALTQNQREREIMLNSTHDAIIAVNREGIVTLFNRAAERLMGIEAHAVLGTAVSERIPNTRLHIVLETGQPELNQEQILPNQTRIITNRVPVRNERGEVAGAVAIFRDITDIMALAEEVTDLKELKSMLQAIINSSDEAISVVDAKGNGLLINPAYTRITVFDSSGRDRQASHCRHFRRRQHAHAGAENKEACARRTYEAGTEEQRRGGKRRSSHGRRRIKGKRRGHP